MSDTTRVRIVSDLHVGSEVGLWPPGMVDDNGRQYPQNPAQRYLWECWTHLWANAPEPDLVVVNGDLVEGPDRRTRQSLTLTSTSMDLQQQALLEVLRLAVQPDRWYCVRGSPYHEPERLGVVAKTLGARTHAGRLVPAIVNIELQGWRLHFRHHPGSRRPQYRGTALDRALMLMAVAAYQRKLPRADVVVLSHLHQYGLYQHCGATAVLTPAWQLQTEYAQLRDPIAWLPDIGAVDIVLQPGELPWVEPIMYATPEVEVDVLDFLAQRGDAWPNQSPSRRERKS